MACSFIMIEIPTFALRFQNFEPCSSLSLMEELESLILYKHSTKCYCMSWPDGLSSNTHTFRLSNRI